MSLYTTANLFTVGMKTVAISFVTPNTPILCFTEEGNIVSSYVQVEGVQPSPVTRLIFSNGTYLDCTDDSLLMTETQEWKPVSLISHSSIPLYSIYGMSYPVKSTQYLGIFLTYKVHSELPYLLFNGLVGR